MVTPIYIKKNNSEKDIIKVKIIPILSQDIIFTLPSLELKEEDKKIFNWFNYEMNNSCDKYNSLDEYLKSDKKTFYILTIQMRNSLDKN